MIEGYATKISFARELTLLGSLVSVFSTPGRFAFSASKLTKTKIEKKDIYRHFSKSELVHKFYGIEFSGEIAFNDFVYNVLVMLFNESSEVEEENVRTETYYLRDEDAGNYCKFWFELEDGTGWKVEGAVINQLTLNVTSRQTLSLNMSLTALLMTEHVLNDPDETPEHEPVAAHRATLHTIETSSPWPADAGLAAIQVLTFSAQFNYSYSYEPAQFGLDGLATKYRKSGASVSGVIICESDLKGELLVDELELRHLLRVIRHNGDELRFYFDTTVSTIQRQDALSRGSVVNQIEFLSIDDNGGGISRLQIIEQLPDLSLPFDYAIIRYKWGVENGVDLDTRTAFIAVDESINGDDVGWSRSNAIQFNSFDVLTWGGDNTSSQGPEAILVDFKKLSEEIPSKEEFKVRLRAFWYSTRDDGNLIVEFETYLGGTMEPDGFDFVNVGGTLQQTIQVSRNATTNISADVDGDDLGFLLYDVDTQTAEILDP